MVDRVWRRPARQSLHWRRAALLCASGILRHVVFGRRRGSCQGAVRATLYLDGDEAHAREQSERAARDCGARLGAVKATVRWELERVAQEQGDLAGRATTYSRRFLTE